MDPYLSLLLYVLLLNKFSYLEIRIDITSIDVCVHTRSQHRGIYDTHDTTTAPHTDRPFDAVEGATALSAARFHFIWACVYADSLPSAPLLSAYFPFFHCRGLDFVTGFEEPDSALLPPSGSFCGRFGVLVI